MKFGTKKLAGIYKLTKVFICNVQEAQRILDTKEDKPLEIMKMMSWLGPKIVVITDGNKGAYAYNGDEAWFMPPYPDPKPPYERTGAGDAFSSTFVSTLAMGKTIEEALMMAPINSMSVVQKSVPKKACSPCRKLKIISAKRRRITNRGGYKFIAIKTFMC